MGSYSASATMDIESDHEKASLISALSDSDIEEDEVVATETSSLMGASTQTSNATSKSENYCYFAIEQPPMHTFSRPLTSQEDEVVATETSSLVGAATQISNATSKSGDSYYFATEPPPTRTFSRILPSQQDEVVATGASSLMSASTQVSNATSKSGDSHSHKRSDSLCYSTNSSVNSYTIEDDDFCEHKGDDENDVMDSSRLSYLGSIINSLNAQQSFPSSMFPGQKLISPSSKCARKSLDEEEEDNLDCTSLPRAVSSYYYYEITPYSNRKSILLPPTYHTADVNHSNVYQKTRKGFCNDPSDIDTDDDTLFSDYDGPRSSSWRRCVRCFFSPRVLLTLAICGILGFNLLRLGGHNHHHHHHKNGEHHHNHYLQNHDDDIYRADYSKLRARVIGDSGMNSRLGFSSLLRFAKEINNEIDTPLIEENTGKRP